MSLNIFIYSVHIPVQIPPADILVFVEPRDVEAWQEDAVTAAFWPQTSKHVTTGAVVSS